MLEPRPAHRRRRSSPPRAALGGVPAGTLRSDMKKIVLALLALSASGVHAQDPAAEAWRRLAALDAAAALRLIEENHPGAAPSLGDHAFLDLLRSARTHVQERLPGVSDYDGYAALMGGLATDFRDGHIWSNSRLQKTQRTWAGFIIVRQAGHWMVGRHDASRDEGNLAGARLVACDGVEAEAWAATRIGLFRGNPDIEAQLAAAGPWLLLDDGNPFLTRPATCTFQQEGQPARDVVLAWRGIGLRALEGMAAEAYQPPRAGMGVQPFSGGHWIALETLGSAAAAVVSDVERQATELRASPMVVIDLRGNGGGNSAYASAIAAALMGSDALASAFRFESACSGAYWRAGAGNIEAMTARRPLAQQRGDIASLAQLDELIGGMQRALSADEAFSPALPACARDDTANPLPPPLEKPPTMSGRLIVVTDRHCFSSCLIAVALFRQLGALQVGEATDVSTRYMEVREIVLPSGLRTFSTLQKVTLGIGDFGPYTPHVVYPGALADTDALREWVAALH
jgi:hypothetical protein